MSAFYSEKQPEAIDLSHHLSYVATNRHMSPLKDLIKYMQRPGIISMAGGVPNPDYFPYVDISANILTPDAFPLNPSSESGSFSWLWKLFGSKDKTRSITIDKYPVKEGDLNLATSLQYGTATGAPQLIKIQREIVEKIYQPAYSNWTTLVHTGNTDGWGKIVNTFLNPGDIIIVSEWTYPSALSGAQPYDIVPVPVAMDGQGMKPDALKELLANWDEAARGKPRPHLLYTVPVGQNPTGATMWGARKKAIYDICVEYDVIIVEDDPYYFLQIGPYLPKSERPSKPGGSKDADPAEHIASLAPSYLKFDYQGRVIRLDTFSKTVAPGSRLGWFTCNPVFAERLERASETTTQAPCGFGQVLVTSLLLNWHYEGYIRWLRALRIQYLERRDHIVDCLAEEFHIRLGAASEDFRSGLQVYEGRLKPERGLLGFSEKDTFGSRPAISFVPPSSGMFVWMKIHFEDHPSFGAVGYKALEKDLWIQLAEAGVVFGPGTMFHATPVSDEEVGDGHFRISFSMLEHDEMKKAVSIFATVLRKFMKAH